MGYSGMRLGGISGGMQLDACGARALCGDAVASLFDVEVNE